MAETFIHRNGGGGIYGVAGGIGSDCLLDRESHIEGASFVSYKSSLTNSALKDSTVSASAVHNSALISSHVAGAFIGDSALENVIVRGTKENKALVENAVLSGGVVVEGCTVRNCEIDAPILIHRGTWDHAPRHHVLRTDNGVVLGLSECVEDRWHVGCRCAPYAKWDKEEPRLRRLFVERQGWPAESFSLIRIMFERWRTPHRATILLSEEDPYPRG